MDETVLNNRTEPPGHIPSELMSLALDGLLEPGEQQHFDAHLSECDRCTDAWQRWLRVSNALMAEPYVAPSAGFILRVDQAIRRDETRRERLWGGLVLVGGTLAILTVLMMGLVLVVTIGSTLFPEASLGVTDTFSYAGQAIVMMVRNMAPIRDALLALLPGPGVTAAIAGGLVVLTLIWLRLVRSTGRRSIASGRRPSQPNQF